MPEQYLTQDQLLLAGVEASRGVEEALTPAANAVKTSALRFAAAFEVDDGTSEHTSSLDSGEPIP